MSSEYFREKYWNDLVQVEKENHNSAQITINTACNF